MAANDPDVKALTDEEIDELKAELEAHREAKKLNARPNNRSATKDVTATIDRVTVEVSPWLSMFDSG